MKDKIDKLIDKYNISDKKISSKSFEWEVIESSEYSFDNYIVNIILNKKDIYEVVISIEKNKKLVFATKGIEINIDDYNNLKDYISNNTLEAFINKYYDMLYSNVK